MKVLLGPVLQWDKGIDYKKSLAARGKQSLCTAEKLIAEMIHPRGEIRTPAFMPVGTAATVKAMMP